MLSVIRWAKEQMQKRGRMRVTEMKEFAQQEVWV
jgi:hypothetical protein